ncbi:MAG: hypothetical protein WD295_05930 [Bacteroidota bacterium]
MVYSILSNVDSLHLVRVYTTYDPSGFDPLERTTDTGIRGAVVRIAGPSGVHVFADTLVPRTGADRYTGDIPAYTSTFTVRGGDQLVLTVEDSLGRKATGSLRIPDPAAVLVQNAFLFQNPQSTAGDGIFIIARISAVAKGILVRCFFEYDRTEGGTTVPSTEEIPQSMQVNSATGVARFSYPILVRRRSIESTGSPGTEVVGFAREAYSRMLTELRLRHPFAALTPRRVRVLVIQTDIHLYNYYNIVNGFRDSHTIRTDLPDYTNIVGGLGVFGSFHTDSVFVPLPSSLIF